jgi:hypothetical protein
LNNFRFCFGIFSVVNRRSSSIDPGPPCCVECFHCPFVAATMMCPIMSLSMQSVKLRRTREIFLKRDKLAPSVRSNEQSPRSSVEKSPTQRRRARTILPLRDRRMSVCVALQQMHAPAMYDLRSHTMARRASQCVRTYLWRPEAEGHHVLSKDEVEKVQSPSRSYAPILELCFGWAGVGLPATRLQSLLYVLSVPLVAPPATSSDRRTIHNKGEPT